MLFPTVSEVKVKNVLLSNCMSLRLWAVAFHFISHSSRISKAKVCLTCHFQALIRASLNCRRYNISLMPVSLCKITMLLIFQVVYLVLSLCIIFPGTLVFRFEFKAKLHNLHYWECKLWQKLSCFSLTTLGIFIPNFLSIMNNPKVRFIYSNQKKWLQSRKSKAYILLCCLDDFKAKQLTWIWNSVLHSVFCSF